jgi:hypothetical protein
MWTEYQRKWPPEDHPPADISEYERLRTHQADKFEQMVLEAFQKKVSGEVPVPPGATDIPDYP